MRYCIISFSIRIKCYCYRYKDVNIKSKSKSSVFEHLNKDFVQLLIKLSDNDIFPVINDFHQR